MRSPSAVALALSLALLCTTLAGSAAAPAAATNAIQSDPPPELSEEVIAIDLAADGNATWTIHHRFRLDSEADVEDFEAYAEALQRGDRTAGYDEETLQRHADRAAAETGREMDVGEPEWHNATVEPANESADDPDAWIGTLSTSFTWTNFAERTDRQLRLGDVFASEEERVLAGLNADQRLEIHLPADHTVENSSRSITGGALVWEGPHEFEVGEIYATLERGDDQASGGTDDGTDADGPGDGGGEGAFFSDVSLPTALGGFLVVVILAAGYVALRRGATLEDDDPGDDPDGPAAGAAAADRDDEPIPDPGPETTIEFDEDVDVELLSDEERVLRLLRKNGGRMKQATIVTETDWSNAKVSQLLSQMDDDDEIDKLRIGRENLITLPDVDPTEID